jgi:putative membrane protein
MKSPISIVLLAIAFSVMVSCGNRSNQEDSKEIAKEQNEEKFDDSKLKKDTEFAVKAAESSMLEVQLGKLAQQKASSPQVKKLAQTMVDDHSKANEELKSIAAQKNISLPASLSDDSQKKYNDLAQKTGKEFDKEYIDFMVKEHKEDVDEFKDQAENGNDAELKAWASAKVPALQHHLEMAQTTQDNIKNNNKTSKRGN